MEKISYEEFIVDCTICGKEHNLKVAVVREELPNDIDNDVRVPYFKSINVPVICPEKNEMFETDIFLQEDKYSIIKKLKKA
jgi:hypothetical protein